MQNHKGRSYTAHAHPNALIRRSRICRRCGHELFNQDHPRCIEAYQKQCDTEARKAKEGQR